MWVNIEAKAELRFNKIALQSKADHSWTENADTLVRSCDFDLNLMTYELDVDTKNELSSKGF